jgi:hypothetical protein
MSIMFSSSQGTALQLPGGPFTEGLLRKQCLSPGTTRRRGSPAGSAAVVNPRQSHADHTLRLGQTEGTSQGAVHSFTGRGPVPREAFAERLQQV